MGNSAVPIDHQGCLSVREETDLIHIPLGENLISNVKSKKIRKAHDVDAPLRTLHAGPLKVASHKGVTQLVQLTI